MKNLYLPKYVILVIISLSFTFRAFSQVPMPITVTPGWNGLATAKWDNLNYIINSGNYIAPSVYVTAAMSTTQAFAIGTNRMTIVRAATITSTGQNNTNTGYTNSYGTPSAIISNGGTTLNSVAFNGNGTITITFDTVASHVGFSLYDIDQIQIANVKATDASGNPLNITMSNAAALPLNVITGSGTTSATATSIVTNAANNSNTGTVNVYVDGFTPAGRNGVKTITITLSGTAGDFWLSDITACVYTGFPTNYYLPAKPDSAQPAYTIATSNAPTASCVNLTLPAAANNSRYIFTDNAGAGPNPWVNSFAYDCYNHYLYYVYDYSTATASGSKSVKKYDFNTLASTTATMSSGTISTIIPDVTAAPFNIPVFDQGLTSGGACFYNGSYYIGVEGSNAYVKYGGKFSSSGRYSMIWRIDFNSSGVPTQACQVFAAKADDGAGTGLHNWADFSTNNGILYDFNSAGNPNNRFYHYNLQTGLIVNSYSPGALVPGQSAVDWNGNVYDLSGTTDQLALYNNAGGIGTLYNITGKAAIDWTTAGAGDASDAFKPPIDYGDAPASYDPNPAAAASHDYDSTLRLGTLWNAEFVKKTTVDASGDGTTDDGILGIPVFTWGVTTYSVTAKVYNHTGANATLAGWIDVNNNGVFESGEGVTVTVPSSTAIQNVVILWPALASIPVSVTHVFMRIRVTSASNLMTNLNPTGYFSNGEVEDYYVQVLSVLPVNLISFSATPMENKYVKLAWEVTKETDVKDYSILRSSDGVNWVKVADVKPTNAFNLVQQYSTDDLSPLDGTSYYKLQLTDNSGAVKFSETQKIKINNLKLAFGEISPNPFNTSVKVNIMLPEDGKISYRVMDVYGKTLVTGSAVGYKGNNTFDINNLDNLPSEIYLIQVTQNGVSVTRKLIKN